MAFNDANRFRKTYSFFRARPVPIAISISTAEEINMLTLAQYLTGTLTTPANGDEVPIQVDVLGRLKVSGTFGNADSSGNQIVVGGAVSGSTAKGAPVLIAGTDSSNVVRVPQVDSNKALLITGSVGLTIMSGTTQPLTVVTGAINVLPLAQYASGTVTLASGQLGMLQLDQNAFLKIREQYGPVYEDNVNGIAATINRLIANATYSPSVYTNPGVTTTGSIKTTTGNIFSCYVDNLSAKPVFFLIINKATAGASADLPALSFLVPASGSLSLGSNFFVGGGVNMSTGIAFAMSQFSRQVILTDITASNHSVNITYL